jgi:hypothetical protein
VKPLRFALLEHERDGVHWDLLLEIEPGGALRTWALDEPPSPGREIAAQALADHRTIYLNYEGEIAGGRGRVRHVDGGEYDRRVWTDDCVEVDLRGGHLGGSVELRRAVADESSSDASGGGGGSAVGSAWVLRFGKRA